MAEVGGEAARERVWEGHVRRHSTGWHIIADWAPNGAAHGHLQRQIADATAAGLTFTHVLFHQGERDTLLKTPREVYLRHLIDLHESIRAQGVAAPFHICRASLRAGVTSGAVREAQELAIDHEAGRYSGPDTDRLHGSRYRADGTHFTADGMEAFSNAWLEALLSRP